MRLIIGLLVCPLSVFRVACGSRNANHKIKQRPGVTYINIALKRTYRYVDLVCEISDAENTYAHNFI